MHWCINNAIWCHYCSYFCPEKWHPGIGHFCINNSRGIEMLIEFTVALLQSGNLTLSSVLVPVMRMTTLNHTN